jgi:outer membrane protein assembly factor BamD (BamD/ComL family)
MGRERIRSGQQICFCIAVLSLLAGCSAVSSWDERQEIRKTMREAQSLLSRGDYDGSATEYQKALRLAQNRSPADAALFKLGLIYSDPQNPKRDDQKGIDSFAELLTAHPQSPWAVQAKIWLAMLDEKERSKQEIEKSKQAIENFEQEIERLKQLIEKSRQEIEKSRQEVEKSKQVVEKSKQALEKSNQVDIEIEQKKRERGR